jgi:hypothetical protein
MLFPGSRVRLYQLSRESGDKRWVPLGINCHYLYYVGGLQEAYHDNPGWGYDPYRALPTFRTMTIDASC